MYRMQRHRRRFDYFDAQIKGLKSDSIEVQEDMNRVKKMIRASKR